MQYIQSTFKSFKKKTMQYWNPNENPKDLDRYAINLLDKAEVDSFIQLAKEHPELNINVVDFNKASLLIKANDITNRSNPYRRLIAQQQLEQRAIKAIEFLISRGCDINYQDKNGITALLSAVHWGNEQIAQILLRNGANPDLCSNTNNFYLSPLISAMFKKNISLVVLLLKHGAGVQKAIDLNQKGNGFKLSLEDINFLKAAENVIAFVNMKHSGQNELANILPGVIFDDICLRL